MTINELILRGSKAINVRPEVITSPTRKDTIAITRHAIATIAYNPGYKYPKITAALHRKSHASIINGCRRGKEMQKNNRYFRAIYKTISENA